MLRDLAEIWFRANCPPVAPVSQFLRNIDEATQRRRNCWFRFGPNTTRDGAPWLLYCYEEEFFAFKLDERQARLLNLTAGQVVTARAGQRLRSDRYRPPATLTRLEVNVATTERIAGTIMYDMPYNHMLPYCLRMTWDRPDGPGINVFHTPAPPREFLSRAGTIPFDFQLRMPDTPPVPPGLVLVFFALNTTPLTSAPSGIGAPRRALSDTCARLIELR